MMCNNLTFFQTVTKGGYLEGRILLPKEKGTYKIVLSTHSVFGEEDELRKHTMYGHVHPTMLHLVRKDGKRRVINKEQTPTTHHWRMQLIIREHEGTRQVTEDLISEGLSDIIYFIYLFIHLLNQNETLTINYYHSKPHLDGPYLGPQ